MNELSTVIEESEVKDSEKTLEREEVEGKPTDKKSIISEESIESSLIYFSSGEELTVNDADKIGDRDEIKKKSLDKEAKDLGELSELSSVASWVLEKSDLSGSDWSRNADEDEKKPAKKKKAILKKTFRGRKNSFRDGKSTLCDFKKTFRNTTMRLKCIYGDVSVDFGADPEDEETLAERFATATKFRETQLRMMIREMRRSQNVELCFLVDATYSMQPHIDGVKNSILKIVGKLIGTEGRSFRSMDEIQELRLAFVAYRDHGDIKQFELLRFTKSTTDFQNFCSNIQAAGGRDICEDVFGGLEKVLELDWSDQAGTKVLFHICDAPAHGREYNNGEDDSYPNGDPKGRTHEGLIAKLRAKNIQYHFGKINMCTDLMLKKFSEAYGEPILEFDVNSVDNIKESVIGAVSASVVTSFNKAAAAGTTHSMIRYTFDKEEPDWMSCPKRKGKFLSYNFPDSIKDIIDDVPLSRRSPKAATVKIGPKPFAKGAERVAFYGKDLSPYDDEKDKIRRLRNKIKYRDDDIVLKEYLHTGMNSTKRYELSNQMQTIVSFMAGKFSTELERRLPEAITLKFLKIRTLFVDSPSGECFMSCERRFSVTDKFIRFTNNAYYELTEEKSAEMGIPVELLHQVMAFSHWTYKATKRFLMVVDLQGIVSKEMIAGKTTVLLTDPAIHCQDLTRYGRTNHGKMGMNRFFGKHKCNQYCYLLGLDSYVPITEDKD